VSRLVAIVSAVLLLLAACGTDDDGAAETETTAPTTAPDDTEEIDVPAGATIVSVSDDLDERPELELEPIDEAPDELVVDDIVEGDGDEVQPGDTVEVQYLGVLTDGTEFDSSWSRDAEPISFGLNEVIVGWGEGLVGMREGGRRSLVIPADLAYGAEGRPGIPPDATLVFVVDLLSIQPEPEPGDDGMPTPGVEVTSVSADLDAAPEVELAPAADAPEGIVVDDIVAGDGATVSDDDDDRVEVHFVGLLTDGTEYESSWAQGLPVEFNLSHVIEGVGDGLRGMQVGGRRVIVVPPDLGYGPMGTPNMAVPPEATLVYVFDLLAVL
jgi:peptidylprolyl isomerase